MDKIICDVCGTGYPESSESCPICGSPRRADASHAMGQKNANAGYTYVKGGRFSSSNVRRRSDNKVEGDVTEKSGDRKNPIL